MKKFLPAILFLVGALLIIYFGFAFILFSTIENPLLWPITTEPILGSLVLIGIGIVLLVLGYYFRNKMKTA